MTNYRFVSLGHVVLCALLFSAADVRSADCNLNKIDDAEEIASGARDDCNDNQIPDECEFAPIELTRTSESEFALEFAPLAGDAADLNGDGLEDLVLGAFVSSISSGITVRLTTADGTFDDGQTFEAGVHLKDFKLGDLDGDGDLDAFVGNFLFVGKVGVPNKVWLNDGAGNFQDSG